MRPRPSCEEWYQGKVEKWQAQRADLPSRRCNRATTRGAFWLGMAQTTRRATTLRPMTRVGCLRLGMAQTIRRPAHDTAPDDHGHHDALMRFFDSQTGGHFFTNSIDEQNMLLPTRPDLKPEGMSFLTDDQGTSAVFRFFNTDDGAHFLLATRPDLKPEGISFYAPTT